MQKNKMEEVQARRGLFKSGSKGVMPMITLLDVTTSAKVSGGGCDCYGGCGTACFIGCATGCNWQAPCKYNCTGSK